ncbi:MAG: hypothetical protein HYU69_15470 [Bacteroidetes bacterium]|nr:hypothetical protein [Bacteroidota bacterium]
MKTASSDLYLIIHSLSAPEKAYIIRNLRKNRQDSHYLKLFALINKQAEFDENSLLNQVKTFLPKKKFIHVKNRMNEVVLNKLENYHSGSSVNFIIQSYIKRAELFQSRNEIGLALKFLEKAKKLAIEQEKFEYYLLIHGMILSGYRITSDVIKLREYLNTSYKEHGTILEKIRHNEIYKKLAAEADLLGMRSGNIVNNAKDLKKLKGILNSGHLKKYEQTRTISAALNFLYIQSVAAKLLKQNDKALQYQKRWLIYLRKHLTHWEKYPEQYLYTLSNICGMESDQEKRLHLYDQAKEFIELLPPKDRNRLFPIIISNFVNLVGNVSPTKAIELFNEIKGEVKKYSASDTVRLVLYLNMSINYFIVSDLRSMLKCLIYVIQYKGEHRIDAQLLGRFYFLICHFELKNYELIPYLINSYQKWIAKHCPTYKIELETLLYFKKTLTIFNNMKQQKEFFIQMKNDLGKIPEQNSSLINKDNFFLFWLDSKIENKLFIEIMKNKKKKSIK